MRARLIKPGYFKNDDLAALPALARILFSGLWCLSDRAGRLDDRPLRIKAEVLPYDDCDCDALLKALAAAGFIVRYVVDSARYIQVVKFPAHQTPHVREPASAIPPPGEHQTSTVQAQVEHQSSPAVPTIPVPTIPDPEDSPSSPDGDGQPPEPMAASVNGSHPGAHAPPWPDMRWINDAFDTAFWPPYPRKTHKAEARSAFIARMKRHRTYEAAYADLEELLEALVEQAVYWTDPAYTPHPATYIRGERDKDEIIVPTGRRRRS